MIFSLKAGATALVVGGQESLIGRSVKLVKQYGKWWLVKLPGGTFLVQAKEVMPLCFESGQEAEHLSA